MSLFVEVRRVLQYQMLVMVMSGSVAYVFGGREAGVSALLGGLIGFLPNAYFAVKFGRKDPGKSADELIGAFYVGETIKLIITALLFVLVFQLPGILFLPLFIGFGSVIAVYWFALLLRN